MIAMMTMTATTMKRSCNGSWSGSGGNGQRSASGRYVMFGFTRKTKREKPRWTLQ